MATSNASSFDEVVERLDEIVEVVRSKDTTLERSLDLFDEAIALGLSAVELVDAQPFSADGDGEAATDHGATNAH